MAVSSTGSGTVPATESNPSGVKNPYGAPGGDSSWKPSYSYAGSHHYYVDDTPRPSAADLAAERARTGSSSSRRSYSGAGIRDIGGLQGYTDMLMGMTTPAETEPAEPVDTSAVRDNLYNNPANANANKALLENAGLNFPQQTQLNVPGQVALPNEVALPNNIALPNEVALPNNVNLPNEIALPDKVALPDQINFQQAMQEAGVDVGRVNNIDTVREEALLGQLTEAQRQQAINSADYNVAQGTAQLQRQMQEAQRQFQTQQRQIDIDEARAKDNQALYTEARGDRGGIGQAQYDTIQNTAATNRLTVQTEQTQLATDTARQVADLRAQGEFEKANQLLNISQQYLSKLMDLSTWAKEANVGIDEFNLQVAQWEENYKLSLVDAQLEAQASNLNLAKVMMEQNQNQFNNAYQQENSLYNARWNQAQQLWQNAYQQENSLYNARWNQATDLFNAAYNQEQAMFDARRNAANDYLNNQINAGNYGINARNAALEAQLKAAEATGSFADGTPTYQAQQNARQILAASGQALLEKGIIPTAEQLSAMGMLAEQAAAIASMPTASYDRSAAGGALSGAFGLGGGTQMSYYPSLNLPSNNQTTSSVVDPFALGYGGALGGLTGLTTTPTASGATASADTSTDLANLNNALAADRNVLPTNWSVPTTATTADMDRANLNTAWDNASGSSQLYTLPSGRQISLY